MPKKMEICPICLRTDRKLKVIDTELADFHDELCEFAVLESNRQYCLECEYLLRKTYKFRAKCVKATELLKKWKKSKDKKPITHLCTLLPEPDIKVWTSSDNAQIYTFIHEDMVSVKPNSNMITLEPLQFESGESSLVYGGETVTKSQDLLGNPNSKDIKVETEEIEIRFHEEDSLQQLNDVLVLKDENATNTFEKILFKSDGNLINESDNDEVNDILRTSSSDSSDDDLLISLKDKDLKKNEDKQRKCKRKTSENSDIDSADKEDKTKEDKASKRRKCNVKEKNASGAKRKKDMKTNRNSRFQIHKGIVLELKDMVDSKAMGQNGGNLKLCKKLPFSKERLKKEIKCRFDSCGELRTSDGTVIDKEFILRCLDDKVTDFVMEQLYQAIYRKSGIKPKALKLFKCIQNKYTNEYDSVFDIEYLNTKEKMLEEFEKRKTYESYITAEFKCEICYQGFKHEKKLQYHMKCHEESAGEMICSICKVRRHTMKSITGHMSAHEAIYRCKLCPLVTYYKSSMENHYQQHKGVKYTCKQCNTIFGSRSAFRTHVSYRHARGHVCTACGKGYSTRVGLRAHITREHRNEVTVTDDAISVRCEDCALTLASSEAYLKHLRVTHRKGPKGRPPGSTEPGRMRNSSLPRRRPVMACRLCNAAGSSWGWMTLHYSMEHPEADLPQLYADKHTHLCDICGKSFSTIYTLQAHLNVHSGARPFACDTCSARFHRAISLRLHRLVHTPPSKPCDTCGKKFRSTSNLHNHIRSHIGDRRYKCTICGKGFIHRNMLTAHVRGVHRHIRRVRKKPVTDATDRGVTDATERCH